MTISFSKLGTYGRLGNSLFQISAVLATAKKFNAQAAFPDWKYEEYFANPIPHGSMQEAQVKEENFNYYDWNLKGDCDLVGYMQTEKYFEGIKDSIKEQFRFKEGFAQSVKEKMPAELWERPVILMQVRRTDYVGCAAYYQLPVTYYIDALITHFPDWQTKYNIVFISDDLSYPKIHFEGLPNVYFADVFDIEQIALASFCDHFIIANSSFGWWASWLAEKPHSKIIHCGRLHDGRLKEKSNEEDYYPARWINFKKDEYKLDLMDCTFTIPVYFDHKDRKQNLDLCVCMLQTCFKTRIVIGEQGGNRFEYMSQWSKYMSFDMKYFHRTKMLNDMAVASETPYVANWDADVIISPMQIYLTVMKLRQGADMVFPYDGRFARLPRDPWFKAIEKLLDLGAIGDTEPKGRRGKPIPESSVGGAVFFNKESFIDGGMENEYMISYGPEDCERNDRFEKLGFKIERVGGCLYHIDHWCGPDSCNRNPFFKDNKDELTKIRAMSKDELRIYVDSFPWRHMYTEAYYRRICEESITSAREIYKAIGFKKGTVIDIGAGIGEFHNDNPEYIAVDWNVPAKSLLIPKERYINLNLETGIVEANKKYDLCICLEVAEHLNEHRADIIIDMLCQLSDNVLFSAAVPYQGGTGHYTERWQEWWAEKFYRNGFGASSKQPDIKNNPDIALWYRQNVVLYKRGAKGKVTNFILPDYYEQIVKNLKNQLQPENV